MRRKISFLLTLALLMGLCLLPANAAQTQTATVSLSSGTVQPGGDVTLTLSIADNPGISGAVVYFYYDTSVFTVDPDSDLSVAGSFRSSGNALGNTISLARTNGRYFGEENADGVLALWYNSSGLNTDGDGDFLKITLHANASAASGSYTIGIGYSSKDVRNQDGDKIALRTSDGSVTVSGSAIESGSSSGSGTSNSSSTGSNTGANSGSNSSSGTNSGTTNSNGTNSGTTDNSGTNSGSGSNTGTNSGTTGTTTDNGTTGTSTGTSGTSGSTGTGTGTTGTTGTADTGNSQLPGDESTTDSTQSGTESSTETTVTFSDVEGNWAQDFIRKAAELGLINGYTDGTYRPDKNMTRAELVTILWRSQGSPAPTAEASFTDLPYTWYQDAIAWAEETGVVNGVGNGRFDPEGEVTREQLTTILHRLAGNTTGMEAMLTTVYDSLYTDSSDVEDWAKASVYWAVYNEIYCGENELDTGSALHPLQAANRAQIAVMMVRFLQKYDVPVT